jgi:predicted lipoprotein
MSTAEEKTSAGTPVRRVGHGRSYLPRIIGASVVVALAVAMAASTRWLTAEQVGALTPKPFSAREFAAQKFPEIQQKVVEKAVGVTELAPALAKDEASAGAQFGVDSGSGKFAIPVKAEGTVASVDENWIVLDTPDVKGFTVRIPVGTTISGNPIRDVTGDIHFGDFTDQTTYQEVANQLKLLVQREIMDPLDKGRLQGGTLSVAGAFTTGGAPNQIIIQPVKVEVR